jgi:hypothetical protein
MAQQTINIGTAANDGTGDALRTAFGKVNSNTNELYADKADASSVTASLAGKVDTTAIDTDSAMTANSDEKVPSQKAVKAAIAAAAAGFAIKTITATGATVNVDLDGVSYIVFNQASPSTIHTFANAKGGKLYYFWFQNGNTTIDRNNASLIGGASITFTTGQGAIFIGEGSAVRQVTSPSVAS